ncbi:glyoxylase-like metal-dependent hydrolase (beta-lactamase superfamily II) [Pedobacter cryoconitis]|uniref:Glyoxylase-like metal-dependent hydrolase (Beta-lactamase superfamily II) n=1 Tax=Pedobacter cryoconitis TaxID=188932 RepID=A0A7W8ZSV5_9SPHI|nr:MBL fold metallo-hydrolase [Pedobacter cryoconitis]MBB5639435.1 glyoxylase-like metal-dependent hydrolase (beta-lactamase superfamily II) [Pedobacter cryoconitis]
MKVNLIITALLLMSIVSKTEAQSIRKIETNPLKLTVYNAPETSLGVASVIVSGKTDAILVDAQFTLPDAEQVVAELKKTGKNLKAVYISHGDPDFYFGLEVIKKYYPEVTVFATAQTVDHIKATAQGKLDVWGPQLKSAAPKNIVLPQILKGNSLELEGQKLEILSTEASPERSFVWIPSIKAVIGGINVFGDNFHVWLADDATTEKRTEWIAVLNQINFLKPEVVIPAHAAADASLNLASVHYTKEYLEVYEQELKKEKTSAGLIAALKKHYPNARFLMALELSAKVNTGEMQWH